MRLELDEALIALFIGAMNANDHIRARVASQVIEAMLVKNHL